MRAARYELVQAPVTQCVPLSEMKRHLKVDDDERDADVTAFTTAGTERIERLLERQLLTADWKMHLPCFPSVIEIRKCPVRSVSAVTYLDENGIRQTLSSDRYELFAEREPAEIAIVDDDCWPSTRKNQQAVTVAFSAGYGNASEVPESLKSAIKLVAEGLFYGCEDKLESAVNNLAGIYRWGM